MKILFVSPTGAFFSGAEVAIVNLMTYLVQQGHEVYNVIPDNESNTDQAYLSKMAEFGIQCYALPRTGWWWEEAKPISDLDKNANRAYQQEAIAAVRRIIREEQIDLVMSNTVNVFQGALAAACEQVPHYYIIHEFPFGEFGYYREKIDVINRLSTKIFAVTGQLYDTLTQYFPTDKLISFVPYSHVDERALLPGPGRRLVSVGGINERKNQLELIKAYHQLDDADIKLVFIGGWEESYKKVCDDYIAQHQLTGITFLGHQQDPWSHVTDQDMIIFTSSMEAFPLVYVEALLNGIPAICSNIGGHLSVHQVFELGTIYELGNVDQLTQCIREHCDHFDALKAVAQAAKGSVRERYHLERACQPFLASLETESTAYDNQLILQLQTFFGLDLDQDWLERLKWHRVTVFHADAAGHFSLTNAQARPLENQANIEISIGEEPQIRIDLSEFPAAVTDLRLVSKKYQTVLEPQIINGFRADGDVLLIGRDPQLIYDTRHFANDTLTFSYSLLPAEALPQKLKGIIDEQERNLVALRQTERDYLRLEQLYQELHADYHAVIGSRRWRLPTRVIEFFKRKG